MPRDNFSTHDLLSAKFIAATPTRSGRGISVSFRIGGKLRRHTCYQVSAIRGGGRLNDQSVISDITRGQFSVRNGSLHMFNPDVWTYDACLPSSYDDLRGEIDKATREAQRVLRAGVCIDKNKSFNRNRAADVIREWIMEAFRNGMSKEEVDALVHECVVKSVQKS